MEQLLRGETSTKNNNSLRIVMVKSKYYIMLVAVLAFFFFMSWSFNHINPWVAFGLGILGIYFLNEYINKKRENNESN